MDPKDRSKQLAALAEQLKAQNADLQALAERARELSARGVVIPAVALEPLRRLFERGEQHLAIRLTAAMARGDRRSS